MNKRLLAVFLVSALTIGVFRSISYSNSSVAPVGNTNAPGENTCARSGCHQTFSLQENLEDRLSITVNGATMDENFEYSPGTTYNIQFSILNPKARNGFSLTVLNQSGELGGDLSTTSNDAEVLNGTAGKKYVGHANSLGVSSWGFEWTAPVDSQLLTVYSIANLTNNNGSPLGDSILTKSFSFTAAADNSTGIASRTLTDEIQVISALSENGVVFNIDAGKVKDFNFAIYDAMGRMIAQQEYLLHTGKQQIKIPFTSSKGIYFLQATSEGKTGIYKFVN